MMLHETMTEETKDKIRKVFLDMNVNPIATKDLTLEERVILTALTVAKHDSSDELVLDNVRRLDALRELNEARMRNLSIGSLTKDQIRNIETLHKDLNIPEPYTQKEVRNIRLRQIL